MLSAWWISLSFISALQKELPNTGKFLKQSNAAIYVKIILEGNVFMVSNKMACVYSEPSSLWSSAHTGPGQQRGTLCVTSPGRWEHCPLTCNSPHITNSFNTKELLLDWDSLVVILTVTNSKYFLLYPSCMPSQSLKRYNPSFRYTVFEMLSAKMHVT